ncbi:MAG: BspA family leucine-rich repeat surface protein [Bacteroidaceae bacterium]|nr:BspA family leucine-rich repeat surface protein [Bacteroidaceae bacterium]
MRTLRHTLAVLLTALMAVSHAFAQDIAVTVTPTQSILPPQLMLYLTEPGNYFNVSLSNSGKDAANVYLVMQVEQINPSSGLSLSTPAKRQPQAPIVVPAGSTRILTPAEIRGLFNHIPLNEVQAPEGLFDNYYNGSFGLLPEGQYEMHFTAYRWDPYLPDPVVVSSPSGGAAYFTVCYKAQAPEFLTPMPANPMDLNPVAELDPLSPQFTWKAPVVACNPTVLQYSYSIRIVEVLPNQSPDQSMDMNPVMYQVANLSSPMCMIPQMVINQFKGGKTYAAQVTATSANSNSKMLNYVSIENKGKSTYKLFRIKGAPAPEPGGDKGDKGDKGEDDEDVDTTDDGVGNSGAGIDVWMGDTEVGGKLTDSLYTFRNPRLVTPYFSEDAGARKHFIESDILVAWEKSLFAGGEGQHSDTIKIEYDVELFDNGEQADKEAALKKEPVYKFRVSKEQKDTVEWKNIEEKVKLNDYMLLRVKPVVVKGQSVGFIGDDNVIDFALSKRLSQQFFQCSSTTEIEDTKPTTKAAKDLKGKEVMIGEYQMIIDDIKGDASTGFSGTGRVLWKPFGSTIKICVKFEKLKINKDNIVYEGQAVTYSEPSITSAGVVDKLFSDWGIDNLLSDTGIPYANELKGEAKGRIKGLAESINLGSYYQDVQKNGKILSLLTSGEMDNVHLPFKFPKEKLPENFDVMDIQVASMTFAHNWAAMNIIGEAATPDCDILKDKILVFGAPRVCISPNRFLPKSGHISLLDNFTLTPGNTELTFKAPKDLIEPKDGCYISWHEDKFELLGIDADLLLPDAVKDEGGKVKKDDKGNPEHPKMNFKTSLASWDDFVVKVDVDSEFQLEDLPGFTFKASDMVLDLSPNFNAERVSVTMQDFPKAYKKAKEVEGNINKWQGLYVGNVSVKFPVSLQMDDANEDGDNRLMASGKAMFFDKTGATLKLEVEPKAHAGSLGGWAISLDKIHLEFIQDNFDNCGFNGEINVPLFGAKPKEGHYGNVEYICDVRRLGDKQKDGNGKEVGSRMAYVFLTQNVDDENFDFSGLLAQGHIDGGQTYFLVEAYDPEVEGQDMVTNVELCMGGTLGIGLVDEANDWLKEKTKSLPLTVKIPDVHFAKMRISNVARADWKSVTKLAEDRRKARDEKEKEVEDEHKKSLIYVHLVDNKELKISDNLYIDLGEWSLASAQKKLGPFTFTLEDFKPFHEKNKLGLGISGMVGLVGDKINVGGGITVSADLKIGDSWKDIKLENPDCQFDSLKLDLDFTMLHLKGSLKTGKNNQGDKGYAGKLDIAIKDFFELKCAGGYYEHEANADDLKLMKEDGEYVEDPDHPATEEDKKFAYGWFTISVGSNVGIRVDPVVINRISGGFYFNCRPTKGKDKDDKFGGDPVREYGTIGIAAGLTLSTSAGEKALKADLDLLVCYNREKNCLSTFMFNGRVAVVGGLVKADCSLIYENNDQERYLCVNITVESGLDTNDIAEKLAGANADLKAMKGKLDTFKGDVETYAQSVGASAGLKGLSGDPDTNKKGSGVVEKEDGDTTPLDPKATADEEPTAKSTDADFAAGKLLITFEFKVTWKEKGKTYNTPKWHVYLGEPDPKKRCSFTVLKYNGKIVKIDIGANAYLCLGNELPNGGQLPPIHEKISKFLDGDDGGEKAGVDGSLAQANASRAKAAKALLNPNSCEGGVMVGASAWGDISIDLGLLYGSLESLAGFDCALVNYGDGAFCMNSGSVMGYKGWYGMGQLYAYLHADLGVHVKIGKLIDEKIAIFDASLGGLLEVGLPNPTWVEGKMRIKISLLGGLCKINKKFEFSAGDHCVPFKGNALDGFEMFQNVSLGSDSLVQAICDPSYHVTKNDVKRMTFTTTSSIGSHYRLLDPSYVDEIERNLKPGEEKQEISEEEYENNLALHGSRTYVFDINQDKDLHGMNMGVRLFDLGMPYRVAGSDFDESDCLRAWSIGDSNPNNSKVARLIANYFNNPSTSLSESSIDYGRDKSLKATPKGYLEGDNSFEYLENKLLAGVSVYRLQYGKVTACPEEDVSFREDKGTTFHLTGMNNLQGGHVYALYLTANAYEIDNGVRVWCEYVKNKELHRIKWQQGKFWFFYVKDEIEDKVVGDSLRSLEPYVALAYPSLDGSKVNDDRDVGTIKAYYNDIMHPTIALNRDISAEVKADSMQWILTTLNAAGDTLKVQTRNAKYIMDQGGNCINLEPDSCFDGLSEFASAKSNAQKNQQTYDFSNEVYHLQLNYKYYHTGAVRYGQYNNYVRYEGEPHDSIRSLVDLWLTPMPYGVEVNGTTYNDSWLETTQGSVKEALPYSLPYVGAKVYAEPKVEYYEYEKKLSDNQIIGNSHVTTGSIPYRLVDPYLYFAYLGKYAFVGDRATQAYAFDDAYLPFGTETLIFQYNNAIVNPEVLRQETAKSLVEVRDKMYGLWNDWAYQKGSFQPKYPLPTLLKTISGVTAANQDGKASTVVPRNVRLSGEDYTYGLEDLARSYAGAYIAAKLLCDTLKHYSSELVQMYYSSPSRWNADRNRQESTDLNNNVLNWNRKNRGRYIEVDTAGYNVRIPFYQLPLLFGNCFGDGAFINAKNGNYSILDNQDRTFAFSFDGKSGLGNNDLWYSGMSNLLFFRLNDMGDSHHPDFELANKAKVSAQIFKGWEPGEEPYRDIYQTSRGQGVMGNRNVAWDKFRPDVGLEQVTEFKAQLYRLDCYDITTGQFCLSTSANSNGRGGGPWYKTVDIDANNQKAKNLNDVMGLVAEKDAYLETHFDEPQMQVISVTNKYLKGSAQTELYFVYSDTIFTDMSQSGGKFRGIEIDNYWHGTEEIEKIPWSSLNSQVGTVHIDESFKDALPTSTRRWFKDFSNVTSITGLRNLNTANVTDMSGMFYNCKSLVYVDASTWNTANVTDMSEMFYNCSSLLKMEKGTTANYWYQNFNTSKVESMSYMFAGCTKLTRVDLDNFSSDVLTSTAYMFSGCTALEYVFLDGLMGSEIKDTERMFYNCKKLTEAHFKNFEPWNEKLTYYSSMFYNAPTTGRYFVSNDLTEKIANQIPGRSYKSYSDSNKCFLLTSADPEDNKYGNGEWMAANYPILAFVKTNVNVPNPQSGDNKMWIDEDTPTITLNVEGKPKKYYFHLAWSGSDMAYNWQSDSKKWEEYNKYKKEAKRIIIDKSYSSKAPAVLMNMFGEMSGLREIIGLENLRTSETTSMNSAFKGCTELKSLNLSSFNTEKVTDMACMFEGCSSLEELDLSSFKTDKVTQMWNMFNGCSSLKKLTLRKSSNSKAFNTEKVTLMNSMFRDCSSLQQIELGGGTLNTSNVESMNYMFMNCFSPEYPDQDASYISKFNTSKLDEANKIFNGCMLSKIDLSKWNLDKITNISYWFSGCTNAKEIWIYPNKLPKLGTGVANVFAWLPPTCTIYLDPSVPSSVKNAPTEAKKVYIEPVYAIEYQVGSNTELVIKKGSNGETYSRGGKYNGNTIVHVWKEMEVLDNPSTTGAWRGSSSIKKVIIANDIEPLTCEYFFANLYGVTTIEGLSHLKLTKCKSIKGLFHGCKALTTISGIADWGSNVEHIEDMSSMFNGCESLTSVDLSRWGNNGYRKLKVKDVKSMFYYCKALTSVNLKNFNSPDLADLSYMFWKCTSLTEVDLSTFDTSGISSANPKAYNSMFEGCTSLKKVNLKGLSMKGQTEFNPFYNNSSLEELDLSTLNTETLESVPWFKGCSKLRKLVLGANFKVNKIRYTNSNKFEGVNGLAVITPTASMSAIRDAFVTYGGFKVPDTGTFSDKEPSKEAQVIWTAGNKTLTFFYGLPVGSTFSGQTVTKVWRSTSDINNKSNSWATWASTVNPTCTKVVIDNSFVNYQPTSTRGWFYNFQKLEEIVGLTNLNTSKVTDMGYMFYQCYALKNLDLSQFNTSNVTNMERMFYYLQGVTSLDLSKFNTSKVTKMDEMFRNSNNGKLTSLDLTSFNTTNVISAYAMFAYYYKLKQIKVTSNFSLPKMSSKQSSVFANLTNCEIQAKSTDMSTVKTAFRDKLGFTEGTHGDFVEIDKMAAQAVWTESNKTLTFFYGRQYKVGDTFKNSQKVTKVWSGTDVTRTPVSNMNVPWTSTVSSKVTKVVFDASFVEAKPTKVMCWFYGCSNLTSVTGFKYLNTVNTSDFDSMFSGCSSLSSLDLTDLKTPNASYMNRMFKDCSSLTKLDVSGFSTKSVTTTSYMFSGCTSLTEIAGISSWDTPKLKYMYNMFENCSSLKSLNLWNMNTHEVTNMSCVFYNCCNLTYLSHNFDTRNVTTMRSMFNKCKKLNSFGVSSLNTEKVTDMSYMFYECNAMTSLNNNFKTTSATDLSYMFYNCGLNNSLSMMNLKVSSSANLTSMFEGCSKLRTVYLSKTLKNSTKNTNMFKNCSASKYYY